MNRRSFLKRTLMATALVPVAAVAKTVLPEDDVLTPLNPDPPGAFTTDSMGLFDGDTLIIKKSFDNERHVLDGDLLTVKHEATFVI